jgi:hypothetical protein|tara:strand:- start:316615 stop:317289 length:675 start_codon:yes stop_codon:yes gene_type:complete
MITSFFKKEPLNVHLLHIGKTGGTSLIKTFENYQTKKYKFIAHTHNYTFKDVPKNEKVVFFLRAPHDRFVSGFFSRKRKGQPTYNVPYNAEEEWAFKIFETPNTLAEALSDDDKQMREMAKRAMYGIRHVNTHFSDWLVSRDYLQLRRKNIFYIGFQETFDSDLKALFRKLTKSEFKDTVKHIHKNSANSIRLSEEGIQNLSDWYKSDFDLYDYCVEISRETNL